MLTQEQRDRVQQRLLEERKLVTDNIREFDEQKSESLEEATGELSSYRFHPADLGTESMQMEKEYLLASKEGERFYQIDEALRRLYSEPEAFGRCARCGKDISMERLEMVPFATHCAECQRLIESGEAAPGTPA